MKTITLHLRARPDARETRMGEKLEDGSIKIDLAAPAEDGKANQELRRFLAEDYQVPLHQVEILSGHTHRQKIVRITF